MSEQQNPGTDQTTGEGPADPNTPASSSETAQPQETVQEQSDIKSPDQESDEAREGGGYGNPNSPPEEQDDES